MMLKTGDKVRLLPNGVAYLKDEFDVLDATTETVGEIVSDPSDQDGDTLWCVVFPTLSRPTPGDGNPWVLAIGDEIELIEEVSDEQA